MVLRARLALLPIGATFNEALHHEINTWFRETQKLHQSTLTLKLNSYPASEQGAVAKRCAVRAKMQASSTLRAVVPHFSEITNGLVLRTWKPERSAPFSDGRIIIYAGVGYMA